MAVANYADNIEPSSSPEEEDTYPWSLWQRVVMCLTAFFVSASMSGVTAGHLAFREVILQSKTYLCHDEREMHAGTSCFHHELRLNGVYFVSALVGQLAGMPVGILLDRVGPRITSMLGCLIFAMGCLVLAFSDLHLGWMHHIGYSVLTIGGLCVYLPTLQLVRILPDLTSLIMAVMTSAFDVSAIAFYVVSLLYGYFEGKISVHSLLAGYTIVPVTGFILVTSFYPGGRIPVFIANGKKKTASPIGPSSLRGILKSLDFWMVALFTGIFSTRFTHFFSTFNIHLSRSGLPWSFQRTILKDFYSFLPLGGIVGMTAIGQLLHSCPLWLNLTVLWLLIAIWWEPMISNRTYDSVASSVLLFCLLRPYYYGTHNLLVEKLFGKGPIGRTYGVLLLVSALINIMITYSIYDTDQLRFYLNVQVWRGLRLLAKITFLLPLYLLYKRV